MSDCYLHIIPVDPFYRPAPETIPKIVSAVSSCFSTSIEISVTDEEQVIFFDAGEIPNRINCPSCHSELDSSWWFEHMEMDYQNDDFQMLEYSMPCCRKSISLNNLCYDRPLGFARFAVSVLNPPYEDLPQKDIDKMRSAFSLSIRIILQKIKE